LGKKYAERRLRSTREGKRKGEERPTRTPSPDPSRQCPPGWAAIADGALGPQAVVDDDAEEPIHEC
jgi:hypothetical protein